MKICIYISIKEWISKLRAGDQFEVNFHNIRLPHNVVENVRHKQHAAVVTPTAKTGMVVKDLVWVIN